MKAVEKAICENKMFRLKMSPRCIIINLQCFQAFQVVEDSSRQLIDSVPREVT